jgi:hypothetical protein
MKDASLKPIQILICLAAIAVLLFEWQQARDENKRLRAEAARVPGLVAENERLSALVGSGKGGLDDPKAELLKLRGLVAQLQKQLAASGKSAAGGNTNNPAEAPAAEATAEPRLIPRNAWVFSGYSTAEAAFETVMWAMSQSDLKTLAASLTPEARAAFDEQLKNAPEADLANQIREEYSGLQALRLDRIKTGDDGSISFIVTSVETDDGVQKTRDESVMTFKNIGGEWKLTEL